MKKLFQSNFVTVLILFLTAALIFVAIYPGLFVSFNTSFIRWGDYNVDYTLTFILTNFFYQGGIQLWNFFGQMPFFHAYAVFGLFKFGNVITAMIYYLLAPFSEDSGQLFHHVFVWANLMTYLFIRTIGIFLLLKLVTRNRIILTVGTVIFAVFFSQWALMKGSFYISFFPLGMYFIVRFFQEFQWRYLAAIFLFFAVSLGNGIHWGAYMYLPMHFFMISGILWKVFFDSPSKNPFDDHFWKSFRWKNAAWAIAAAVLILAPYAFIVKFGFPDLAFGQANSRITHPFNPQWYFHNLDLDLGSPGVFFSAVLNMRQVDNMFYLGLSFLFLALAGLILSRNRLKYFFALGVFFLWLLSFPSTGVNIGLVAHWINILTNPLKAVPRSYYFACQSILPYLMMPLVVMGIEAIMELYRGKKYSGFKLGLLGLMTLVVVLNGFPVLPFDARVYLMVSTACLWGELAWVHFRNTPRARKILAGTICFLAFIDVLFIIHQTKSNLAPSCPKSIVLDASPQSKMVDYDFENPSIFPYRYSYTFQFSFRDEAFIWYPHGLSSSMHHVINQGLNFLYINGYNPRHAEFAHWLTDPQMLTYLGQNNEFIFLAKSAINASPDALGRICSAGLARQVIEVEDPKHKLKLPDQWPGNITVEKQEDLQYSQILGSLEDITDHSEYQLKGDMIEYTLHLPSGFPAHLASSWFPSEQRYLRFIVGGAGGQWKELQATQGQLVTPYTFDVQNIKEGDLKAAFPKNDFPLYQRCVLFYPSKENQGVEDLWRRQFDNLGLTYRAKRGGWLVGHYPYDPKWRISVDGKPVPYYRVDKSFIGFPLVQGEHKILIQYWPHSPLRILLLISALLTTFGLPALIFIALRWEQKIRT